MDNSMEPEPIATNEITGVVSYLYTLDWTERWLQGLILFHLVCYGITFLSCKWYRVQMALFFIYLGILFFIENINELCAKNYRLFSKQQYFDSKGMFISLVFSLPVLVNCIIILIYWLLAMCGMMTKVQVARVKHKARAQENSEQSKISQKNNDKTGDNKENKAGDNKEAKKDK